MNKILVIFSVVLLSAGLSIGYWFYWRPSQFANDQFCQQFSNRFGITADELVQKINDEPDSSRVLQGFRYFQGEIVAQNSSQNLFVTVEVDLFGKVISWECQKQKIRLTNQDVSFTIPEEDLQKIINDLDYLDTNQAAEYMRNITTDPNSAKMTILERILDL